MQPLILVTNDDGVLAPGIAALADAASELGEVMVCAPLDERSGQSHAITFHTHVRAQPLRDHWWGCSGTPVDCVFLALHELCPRRPALVLSGVNAGFNLGTDVFYSGTFGAAAEGHLKGLPSMAVSTDWDADPNHVAPFVRRLAVALMAAPHPRLLNVNVPRGVSETARAVVTRLGERRYQDTVDARHDPRGRQYYWIGGPPQAGQLREGDDTWAVGQGLVSVTPIELDVTAPDLDAARAELKLDG